MSKTDETTKALAKGLLSSEAGRRVGWARAFAAESSKDELSRDVNILRMERDVMRRAASFLYGFLRVYLERRDDTTAAVEALSRWSSQAGAVLDVDTVRAGREAASVVAEEDMRRRRRKDARKADARQRANRHSDLFKKARAQERKLLMERNGIPNEAALYNYLAEYRGPHE